MHRSVEENRVPVDDRGEDEDEEDDSSTAMADWPDGSPAHARSCVRALVVVVVVVVVVVCVCVCVCVCALNL